MSSEPKLMPVLEYQSPLEDAWTSVIRICGLAAIALGSGYLVGFAGLAIFTIMGRGYPAWPVMWMILMLVRAAIGLALVFSGISCLRKRSHGRCVLIAACLAVMIVEAGGMTWVASIYWDRPPLERLATLLANGGSLHLPQMAGAAVLFLLLRRPEARRVFEAAR